MVWIKQAAESEDYEAQGFFGEKLAKGEDVEKDLVQAYKWFKLAMAGLAKGDYYEDIGDLVVEISKKMTPEQLKQAEFLTRTWQPPDRKYYLTN
jgi:hypothetical protein